MHGGFRSNTLSVGFSLTELLVVVAVMSALATLSLPRLSSILSGNRLKSGSTAIAQIFETARTHAIARNSYVYVGLAQADAQTVLLGMAETVSGESDIATASAIARVTILSQVELRQSSEIKSAVSLPLAAVEADSVQSSDMGTLSIFFQGKRISFSYVVCFSPSGQATIKQGNTSRYIQIGLSPASRPQTKDLALIQITGLTGNVSVYLP